MFWSLATGNTNICVLQIHVANLTDFQNLFLKDVLVNKYVFSEGDYVKYNSNSGFVEHNSEHVCRNTPQVN